MNRHSLILALAWAATSAATTLPFAAAQGDSAPPVRADSLGTGLFQLAVPERRADVVRVTATVARRFGTARLVQQRVVVSRRRRNVVFVFEIPEDAAVAKAGKVGWLDRALKRLGRLYGADCSEVRRKWAKAKPINLPIFEGDWNRGTVMSQQALTVTAAAVAQGRATGRSQTVAVLDGGFDLRHEFLAGRLAATGYDALDDDDDPQDLGNRINDDAAMETAGDVATDRIVGHGTFVSSLVLAVAPNVKILPIRVLDDEGWGTDLAVAAGVTYAVQNGATVINMSLVLPNAGPIVRDAVRAAVDAGIIIVSAAGTTDDGWQSDPYLNRRSLCVGATDANDVIPTWCLSGPTVHVFAPGVEMRGALGGAVPNSYGRWSGVSFAVPILSAGAAMIREKHPTDWTGLAVRDRLAQYVDPAFDATNVTHPYRGRVDLGQSVPSY